MTACVNRKHTKKVAAVVTASLVGALSLGAAPVAAVADTGIDTLDVADEHEAFLNGTVSAYTIGGVKKSGNDAVTLNKSDLADGPIIITEVTPDGIGAEPIEPQTGSNTYYYKKANATTAGAIQINSSYWTYAGSATDGSFTSLAAGEYIAASTYDGTDNFTGTGNVAPTISFTVVADSLDGVELMKKLPDGSYSASLSYDDAQKWSDLKLVLNDKELISSEATFEVYTKDDDGNDLYGSTNPIQAGTYKVVVNGVGVYAGDEVVLEVTVNKLDLSKTDLYIEDVDMSDSAPTFSSIKGNDLSKINAAYLTSTYFTLDIQGNTWGSDKAGEYTYVLKVKPNTTAANNIEGTATLKFNRVNVGAASVAWTYNTHAITDGDVINVDRSAQSDDYTTMNLKEFDLSKLGGSFTNADAEKIDLANGQYTVTIKDAEGNVVDSMTKKGAYTVTLEADSSEFDYNVDRTKTTFTVNVKQGTIGTADTVFTFDGKVVTSLTKTYDGEDFLARLGIQVKSGDKVLSAGSDYTVTVKDADGKAVDQIVNAGEYTVTITSDLYAITGDGTDSDSIVIDVKPIVVSALSFDTDAAPFKTFTNSGVKVTGIPYTGSEIADPAVVYTATDVDGKAIEGTLPADVYAISYQYSEKENAATQTAKDVESLSAAGWYKAKIELGDDVVNYQLASTIGYFGWNELHVIKDMETGFSDVADEEWYAEVINQAKNNKYIKGYSGTTIYGPEHSIKRADVVCVLFNMANGAYGSTDYIQAEGSAGTVSFPTDFSDCDETAYYAGALAWAAKAGVVNGYDDGTFKPEQTITREEFACMLANFAKLKGDFQASADADATLAAYDDASTVSDWAAENVAWAVESDIMGNGGFLNANGDINRAEVAAMAVNYQPEKL